MNRAARWGALLLLVASVVAALLSSRRRVQNLMQLVTSTAKITDAFRAAVGYYDEDDDAPFRNWTACEHARRQAELARSREIIPSWMAEYLVWHNEQREKLANTTTSAKGHSPNATADHDHDAHDVKYLVVRCHYGEVCGGLSDRTHALPFYLMVANLTRRVLLVHWTKPAELENFWVPPPGGLDWRLAGTDVTIDDIRTAAFHSGHGDGVSSVVRKLMGATPGLEQHVRAKVLSMLLDGGSVIQNARSLFNRWRAERGQRPSSGDAYLGWNANAGVNDHNLFEDVFRLLFRPSPALERAIYDKLTLLDLVGKDYTAAQVRVKNPGSIPDDVALEWGKLYAPGKTAYEAKRKIDLQEEVAAVANSSIPHAYELTDGLRSLYAKFFSNAIACADRLAPGLPIYLASDSPFGKYVQNASVYPVRVASGGTTSPTHIDSDDNRGRDPSDFYLAFVDAYILAGARCLSSNSGFGAFAIRTSGKTCTSTHTAMDCMPGNATEVT